MPDHFIDQFHVIAKCSNKFDCLIKEMLYIRMLKPALNVQSDSIPVVISFTCYVEFVIQFFFSELEFSVNYQTLDSSLSAYIHYNFRRVCPQPKMPFKHRKKVYPSLWYNLVSREGKSPGNEVCYGNENLEKNKLAILGLQPRDKADMLVDETMRFFFAEFAAEENALFLFTSTADCLHIFYYLHNH